MYIELVGRVGQERKASQLHFSPSTIKPRAERKYSFAIVFNLLLTLLCSLINVLKAANQPVPDELLKFGTTVKKKEHSAYGAFYKDTGGEEKVAQKIRFD